MYIYVFDILGSQFRYLESILCHYDLLRRPAGFRGKQSRQMMRPHIFFEITQTVWNASDRILLKSVLKIVVFNQAFFMPFQTFKQKIVHVNCSHFQWTSYFSIFRLPILVAPWDPKMGPQNGTQFLVLNTARWRWKIPPFCSWLMGNGYRSFRRLVGDFRALDV